jgi:phenylpropionate dioxygenase-like ring-hydroxylating dioxygenase large terminal subunit
MDIDLRERLRKELLEFLDDRSTDYAEGTLRIPTSVYTDPEYLRMEFERVTRRYPVIVGHRSELGTEPGSFQRADVAGLDMLIVRQDDGSVKALGNVCRHRGTQLESVDCGRRRTFSCPYHRWSYDRTGALRAMPFDDGFYDVDRSQLSLLEYPAADYAGLIWVLPTRSDLPLDMAAYLGPDLTAEIEASDVADSHLYRAETFELNFGWKAVLDGYTDAYHLQFVHPKTVGPFFHTNVYKCDVYGRHRRMVVARRGIEDFRYAELDNDEFAKYAISGWQLHPGNLIVRPPAHWEVVVVRPNPRDITTTLATLMMLVPEMPTTEKATRFRDRNWERMVNAVVDEDWAVAGTIDGALLRSELDYLIIGRNEKATQHFHRTLAADISSENQTYANP